MSEIEKPAPRVPLCLPIDFRKSYARDSVRGGLLNISITGAFLEHGTHDLEVNDRINIHFKVSGRERVLQASIVWKNINGSGVLFNPENNQDVQIIDDLMYFVKTYRDSKRAVLDSIFSQIKD
ncbi:MAG: PilZ domain-containing protein [Bdellovibrionaceae bacterium]|nr:PilZ domain-containing protein [Pseudobdellovibrionaceae bacterium]